MSGRLLILWCLASLGFYLAMDWIRRQVERQGIVDRRSNRFLAYYYSARIPLRAETFCFTVLFAAAGAAIIGSKLLGHWILGGLTGGILVGIVLQTVWSRSVDQSRKLDLELPHFIILIRNAFTATNGNERFALQYAVNHASMPALRNPFAILMQRWERGADLQAEAEKTKQFFRNPVVWHLLDAIVQEHYGGGSFLRDLDRLAEQARDRFRLSEMRKVATAGSIYALYGVISLNLLLVVVLAIADPAGVKLFRETVLGRLIVGVSMTGYFGILFLAFRLIRLGDDWA
ncbi:type II secretion system F family protein [Effusibacillus lacus]|uniref:Type II secretion system protein GspF domain-containing protein n=1 Tax=Effusibacillus lacus TaxID=1348429 RepID=A0A292YR69_9BACL|nr:hypothetical protein [Effusibacillus lacus]TCS76923.1 hypothetical protein EDD64_101147 [Effusibacillus lacus]GAX91253.1 hypothetical protein EFBL_2919 [Effusibacillus lacus]